MQALPTGMVTVSHDSDGREYNSKLYLKSKREEGRLATPGVPPQFPWRKIKRRYMFFYVHFLLVNEDHCKGATYEEKSNKCVN